MKILNPTRIKAFRLDVSLIQMLERASRRSKVTESIFVRDVLGRRLKIDPLIPAIRGISLSQETFQSILGTTSPDGLEMLGSNLGKKNFSLVRGLFESNDRRLTFLEYLIDILDYEGMWFKVEGTPNEKAETITLRHEYSKKWSLFLKSYLASAYEVVSRDKLQIDVKDAFVIVRFPKSAIGP